MHLRIDVPVGCYLSGGIDSSTVLGIAAKHSAKPIRVFTLAFDHKAYNEETLACETSSHTGAHIHSNGI
ncbi:asparagine synthase-related protein [Leptothermofonsia sp. ETS-13]|uniref:asparagine synthase-related protein n=1 Tax=Leptothermofonsia sp. ETS-13 TaxID=3035696 RepID=UPI003B9FBE3C